MTTQIVEWIGMIAAICTTTAFLPQVIKTWQTRSTKDISLVMYSTLCFGLLLWVIYGWNIGSLPLIAANMITLLFGGCMLVMKLRWS